MCLHAKSNYLIKNKSIGLRYYSSQEVTSNNVDSEAQIVNIKPEKCYDNAYSLKSFILNENKNKSGIYRFTNKLNGNFYIGSSQNLSKRFAQYFNLSEISTVKNDLTISRALIKYGYFNFILEILEYCDVPVLLEREQYYLDLLKPAYNIAKIAGSTLGVPKSAETKAKISETLKDFYGEKNGPFFCKTHTAPVALPGREELRGQRQNF